MTCRYIQGADKAARVAADLVLGSVYFEMTPLPEDWFQFFVWWDQVDRLEALSLQFRKQPGLDSPTLRELMEAA